MDDGSHELTRALENVERLAALTRTGLVDSDPEESFDRLTRLASRILGAPISLVSLVDGERQFFKSAYGLGEPWSSRRETPLLLSFCQHAVQSGQALVVRDARRDSRFANHGAIEELGVIAYLGVPLTLEDGNVLGAFCVIDSRTRRWSPEQIRLMGDLGASVQNEIVLRLQMQNVARARQTAEESEARLRLLLESTGEGIYGVDREGRCTFTNRAAAEMLGYRRDELVGKNMHELIHHSYPDGEPYPSDACRIYHTFRTGEFTHVEHEALWRRDGSPFDAEYWAYPIRRGGALEGAVVTFHDVTARRHNEAILEDYTRQLEESDRRKDEFLAVLGHELRNPLAAISATAELLALGAAGADDAAWAGKTISEQVGLLTSLLDDLLDVGRITRGKIRLKREICDVRSIVDKAAATAEPLVEAREHRLEIHVADGLHAEVDRMRIEQVLVNLLTNAAKYTDPGGEIRVEAREESPDVLLRVVDNGLGIRPELQTEIFEPFHQTGAGESYPGGLGIGLTLVKRLVELHGGNVDLTSEGEGRGSVFTVRLAGAARPRPERSGPERLGGDRPAGRGPASGRRVLVVDDNRDAADGIVRLLNRGGFSAQAVYSGAAALEVARGGGFDAMLIDIGLPDVSGYEIARRMRSEPACPNVTLVALSGYGHGEARTMASGAGFDHHVAKPARLEKLAALLGSGGVADPEHSRDG